MLDKIQLEIKSMIEEKKSPESQKRLVFLIDDVDYLRDAKLSARFYALVKNSPSNCHFVLCGLHFPDRILIELATFQIQSIPSEKLMLTLKETEQFIRESFPVGSGALDAVDHLHWITEGWLMGLRLVVQAYEKYSQEFPFEEFNGSNQIVDIFFRLWVFNDLPNELLTFSYETALIEVLNPSLCDYATGTQDSLSKLERLHELNPFLFKIDHQGNYRYHRLFASWLQTLLLQFKSTQIRTLSTRASVWYSDHDDKPKKAKMLILATDATCLIPLLKYSRYANLITTSAEFFMHVLSMRPEKVGENDPWFCFLAVWTYVGFGQYEEMLYWADKMEQLQKEGALNEPLERALGKELAEQELEYYQLTIEVARAVAHSIRFYNRESIDLCNDILQRNPKTMNPMVKFHLYYSLADSYERIGDLDNAIDCCLQANGCAMASGAVDTATFPNYKRCKIMVSQGHFSEVEALAQSSIPLTNEDSPLRRAFFILLALTQIESLQLEDAKRNIRRSQEDLVFLKNPEVLIDLRLAQIDYYIAENQYDLAQEEAIKTISVFENASVPAAALGFVYIALGQTSILRRSVRGLTECCDLLEAMTEADDKYFTLRLKYFKASLKYLQGDIEGAVLLLDEVVNKAQNLGHKTILIEAAIRKAFALQDLERIDEAIPVIYEALRIGQESGYLMTIANSGKEIFPLLKAIRARKNETMQFSDYVKALVHILASREDEVRDEERKLTPREQEILRMINKGKSRQEISDSLFISLNTTKTHIRNIHRKLSS